MEDAWWWNGLNKVMRGWMTSGLKLQLNFEEKLLMSSTKCLLNGANLPCRTWSEEDC